ncbi:MAG: aminotransferase class V-fold PLP-dependent enzyme [Ignavibacteria bacterium]|nr:aminotransferase class V-fold PLP-dependent enzyme [Ignavibacteria bacterium]
MIEKIKVLEKFIPALEPDEGEREKMARAILKYSEEFLRNIYDLPAYRVSDTKGIGLYDSPIQDDPVGINELLELLKNNVDSPGLNPASRGHLGYIPGGGIYHAALGDYLAAVTNRYAGVFFASPGAVRMENMLLDWMAAIIGYPRTCGGNLTSGGSLANLIGFVTARDAFDLKGKDLEKSVIYLSTQAHHSIDKAIRIAGLRECIVRYIPLGEGYRMKPSELDISIITDRKSGLNPWLIIASAGTTDVGAVDPLSEIGAIAQKHRLWFHLDAAYGGFFVLCDSGKKALKGMDTSDSVVMDPHKGLFLPYGSGAVLVKDAKKLLASHHYEATYMQDALSSTDELSPADLSPELSKHFKGLRLWLPLKLVGVKPFRAMLEEKILLARYFYEKVQTINRIEVGPTPELSVVTFRYVPESGDANDFNRRLVNEIQRDGRVFLSSTVLDGRFTLRLAVLCFRTHLDTVGQTLEILREKIAQVKDG